MPADHDPEGQWSLQSGPSSNGWMQTFKVSKGVSVQLILDMEAGSLCLFQNGRIEKCYVRAGLSGPLVWAVDLRQVVVHEVWAESTQRQRYEAKLCLRPSVKVSVQS